MKILCTADIHINDWSNFSTLDKYGRQSRLIDYLKLADVLVDLANKKECEAIILAGDISEKAIQKPHVLDVLGDFLRKLGNSFPVHLIHGQHDIAVKEAAISKENSILTEICKDLEEDGVHYYPRTRYTKIGDYSFCFQPWQQSHELPEEPADVYVGHGMVKGCTNLEGYIFINGFDHNELMEKFRLSVIGDIHNKQVFKKGSRAVLQPGAPIQNTWKDAHDCGVWIADIQKDSVSLEFFNIHDLSPNTFHQFVYDSESTELIHSRPRIKLRDKKKKEKKLEVKRDVSLIRDTCLELTKDKPSLRPFIDEVFSHTELSTDKVVAKTEVKSVYCKNFLSIDEFSLDFDEFPHACVVVGHNGSGKSTVPEAIYWCLTGNTTKDIPTASLTNEFKESENCKVELKLTINDQEFTIIRERKGKSGALTIFDKDDNPFRRGSIRETQEELYSLLGLKDWQIQMFSYFSAEKASLFSDLGDSAKNDLISQVVGLDFVEKMRVYSKEKRVSSRESTLRLRGSIDEKERSLKANESKLRELKETSNKDAPAVKAKIQLKENQKTTNKEKLDEILQEGKNILDYFKVSTKEDISAKIQELTKKYYSLQSELDSYAKNKRTLEQDLANTLARMKDAEKGTCPECGQSLKSVHNSENKDIMATYKSKVEELKSKINSIPEVSSKEKEGEKEYKQVKLLEKARTRLDQIRELHLSLKADNKQLKLEIEALEKDLENSEENPLVGHLESEIKALEKELDCLSKDFDNLSKEESSWKYLETTLFKRSGELAKELNKQGSKLIQACIDEVTEGTSLKFNINSDLKLSAKFHNGKEMQYSSMSSGQRRLTDIVMMVSLNNLFSKVYNLDEGVLGLAIYDEILSFLDEKYIQIAKHFVDQSFSRKLLIITHDYSLMSLYDSRINVEMSKTGSIYKKSWS